MVSRLCGFFGSVPHAKRAHKKAAHAALPFSCSVGFVFGEVIEVFYLSDEGRVFFGSDRNGVSEDFDGLLLGFVGFG